MKFFPAAKPNASQLLAAAFTFASFAQEACAQTTSTTSITPYQPSGHAPNEATPALVGMAVAAGASCLLLCCCAVCCVAACCAMGLGKIGYSAATTCLGRKGYDSLGQGTTK